MIVAVVVVMAGDVMLTVRRRAVMLAVMHHVALGGDAGAQRAAECTAENRAVAAPVVCTHIAAQRAAERSAHQRPLAETMIGERGGRQQQRYAQCGAQDYGQGSGMHRLSPLVPVRHQSAAAGVNAA